MILLLITGKPGPQGKTDLVPIHSPLDPLKLYHNHVHRRLLLLQPRPIQYCSRFSQKSPTSVVVVWTDGSVPSPLGTEGAGIHSVCGRCSSSSSPSYSAGPVSSSFSAESSALGHGLEWCHSHVKSCHFQSALFLTDSQSAFTLLSSAPGFL